jgi:hypothetical protein
MVTMLDYVEWMVATSLRLSGSAIPYVFDGLAMCADCVSSMCVCQCHGLRSCGCVSEVCCVPNLAGSFPRIGLVYSCIVARYHCPPASGTLGHGILYLVGTFRLYCPTVLFRVCGCRIWSAGLVVVGVIEIGDLMLGSGWLPWRVSAWTGSVVPVAYSMMSNSSTGLMAWHVRM